MTLDANLLYGMEVGCALGFIVGLFVGACFLYFVSKDVTLPW